jgi:hypothetical protein
MKKMKPNIMSKEEFKNRIRKIIREEIRKHLKEVSPYHDKSGRFSSKKDSTCDSTYFLDGDRERRRGSLTNKKDTGRGANKNRGKGRFRCYDNAELWETDLGLLLDEASKNAGKSGVNVEALKRSCRQIGLRSVGEFLDLLDAIERAKRAEYNKQKKK